MGHYDNQQLPCYGIGYGNPRTRHHVTSSPRRQGRNLHPGGFPRHGQLSINMLMLLVLLIAMLLDHLRRYNGGALLNYLRFDHVRFR